LNNVLNTKNPVDNPYLKLGTYDVEYMNLYKASDVSKAMAAAASDISRQRHNTIGLNNILNFPDSPYGAEIKSIKNGMGDMVFSTEGLTYGDKYDKPEA
jgi:hypothetical protein